ncbi:MAG: biotin--[acetyl-CoA-carboxylase] ligase [Acidimicrobiia bacterium]
MPERRPIDVDRRETGEREVPTRSGPGRFREVRHFPEIDSTNRYALDAARAGAPEGLVVVADHQTAGRGRLGRAWEAAPGSSLLVSALLRPPVRLATRVVQAAGLALADAVEAVAGVGAGLKWPNDLIVGDRKLAGILVEAQLGAAPPAVVVGIGCNVNWTAVPGDLAASATACNLEAGRPVDRDALLDALLVRLDTRLDALGDPSLLADYRDRLFTLGQRVRAETSSSVVTGIAVDVAADGELVVEDDNGARVTILAGNVVRLRPEADDVRDRGPRGGAR